jgi:hypothetical protein
MSAVRGSRDLANRGLIVFRFGAALSFLALAELELHFPAAE